MTLTDEKLARLREVASKATPGPWSQAAGAPCYVHAPASNGPDVARCVSESDAAYIAEAHPGTMIALLDRVRELEALYEDAERECGLMTPDQETMELLYQLCPLPSFKARVAALCTLAREQDECIKGHQPALFAAAERVAKLEADRDAAYARGRADGRAEERADVVRWLNEWECDGLADGVERGEHVEKERG